jgi:gliding motility-associated-like protein
VNNLDCYGISEISLRVSSIPELEAESELLYCINAFPETITLSSGILDTNSYSFLWSTGETSPEIEINETGLYSVTVTNENGCSTERVITVIPSNIATITDIQVIDITNNNSISIFVSGEGDYEYALNNINGPYQDNNTFEGIQPGFYTVFVRDKNNCGISEALVSVIGFPKFFTPNNDSDNDYWQVSGISNDFRLSSAISIYDRYGKLLTTLNPLGPGWDGTYNGVKMPTSDYWFKVRLEDGRTFTSHFTLKR